MILLFGIRSEPPLRRVREALDEAGLPSVFVDQRATPGGRFDLVVEEGRVRGRLVAGEVDLPLEEVTAVYARPMDDRALPELAGAPADGPLARRTRRFHELLWQWLDLAPARVVSRPRAMASNSSKPYQARLIRDAGFEIPPSLVTDDAEAVLAFRAEHGRIVFKSASGARSIVREFEEKDRARLGLLATCPVHFQAKIEGDDCRVHVIGEEVFAARARSSVTDYRYSARQGGSLTLEPWTLAPELAARCVDLTRRLGLAFSGIDLKIVPDGRVVCFEVNPCPGYSFYEEATGHPIAAAVARYLAEGVSAPEAAAR